MPSRSAISTWVQRRLFWVVLFLGTLVLGVWGFWQLAPVLMPKVLDPFYRTLRLFTVNLDLATGQNPNWQVWLAAWLAPALVVRGVAELFRDRLHGITARLLPRRMVVFGAGDGVNALVHAADLSWTRRWLRAVVVADPDQAALSRARDLGAWTVAADGLTPASLRKAAVSRSSVVVVMTDDDRRNATIATEVGRLLVSGEKGRIYVSVTSPALARTLERSGLPDHVETTPFSPLALATADVMDALDRADGPLFAGAAAPSVVLFGQGPLVQAVVLELRRRQRVRLVEEAGRRLPAPRVLLVGPDADKCLGELKEMLGAELNLLEIDAVEDPLTQTVELGERTARALLGRDLGRVMVLAADDLAGGSIALTLARHLGRGGTLALVTEGPESTFGGHIAERSKTDATMAKVRVFRVPELACSLRRLEDHRGIFRLARALYEATLAPPPWSEVDDDTRRTFRGRAEDLRTKIGVPLRASAFMAFDPPQVNLLNQLGVDEFTALARAGLVPELRDPEVLKKVGRRLVKDDQAMALEAWCEVARLATTSDELTLQLQGTGARAEDVRRLLLLRRAQFDDNDAKLALQATGVGGWPAGEMLVVLGGTAKAELRALITWTLGTLPYRGTVLVREGGGIATVVEEQAAAHTFAVQLLRADADGARRQVLDLLTARIGADPDAVRVLALPDDPTIWPLVHIFRTLGVPVAWLPPAVPDDRSGPEQMLLGGGAGIVELPVDRATVRAYLRPSRWPGTADERTRVATALHNAYVRRLAAHRPQGDPALRPFDQLSPALQDSNRDIVDDITTKLAIARLRLCPDAEAAWPGAWPPDAERELLAEMEHGRFNAERLLRGWRSGSRDTGRFLSPHLVPWAELSTEYRAYDHAIIADLPAALAEAGYGAAPS